VITGSTLQWSAGMVQSYRTLVFSSTHLLTLKLLHLGLMAALMCVCVCVCVCVRVFLSSELVIMHYYSMLVNVYVY